MDRVPVALGRSVTVLRIDRSHDSEIVGNCEGFASPSHRVIAFVPGHVSEAVTCDVMLAGWVFLRRTPKMHRDCKDIIYRILTTCYTWIPTFSDSDSTRDTWIPTSSNSDYSWEAHEILPRVLVLVCFKPGLNYRRRTVRGIAKAFEHSFQTREETLREWSQEKIAQDQARANFYRAHPSTTGRSPWEGHPGRPRQPGDAPAPSRTRHVRGQQSARDQGNRDARGRVISHGRGRRGK
jgi:hypothetical protein